MGMGEPFLIYDEFMNSVRLLRGDGSAGIADDGFDERDSAVEKTVCYGASKAEAGAVVSMLPTMRVRERHYADYAEMEYTRVAGGGGDDSAGEAGVGDI